MKPTVLTFFNNTGGVGKTSLVYHLAWMFAFLEKRIVVVDLDPQANLTAAFLTEDEIEELWNRRTVGATIYHCVNPLTGVGDIVEPQLQTIATDLYLLPGHVELSGFEEALANAWHSSMGGNNSYRSMRMLSSFWLVMHMAAKKIQADIVLVDIGPSLDAINRSAFFATDYVAIPLGADLFSLQGLKNLGPTLRRWKCLWNKRLDNWSESNEQTRFINFELPKAQMQPIGYLCRQHGILLERPIRAYDKWVQRIPNVYREFVLNQAKKETVTQQADPYCLATIKHYRSLVPMAQEHRKPIFKLTPADGAIGSHANAMADARKDFDTLARKIASKINMSM